MPPSKAPRYSEQVELPGSTEQGDERPNEVYYHDSLMEADVLLINPPYPRRYGGGMVPPIGLCYLAASLRRHGVRTAILDLAVAFERFTFRDTAAMMNLVRNVLRRMHEAPLLIGVGPLVTATLRPTRDIIGVCRTETNSVVITGGPLCSVPGISTVAQGYLRVDAWVSGDGELPIVNIWDDTNSDRSIQPHPGVGTPEHPEPHPYRELELDTLPIPARDLLPRTGYQSSMRREIAAERMTSAFLSRGCPYSCSFCAAPLSSGRKVRRFSPARIQSELAACAEGGFSNVIFYDDCLFVRSSQLDSRVLEFTNAIQHSGWKGTYQLELRCDAVTALSTEAMEALRKSGCRQINMGIEKGHIAQLKQLRKRLSPDVARQACERVRESGIRAAGTFILGGPGETLADISATTDFAETLPLDFAHFNPLAIYPGTTLFREQFGETESVSWLDLCLDEDLAPLGDILWRSEEVPLPSVLDAVLDAYHRFYTRSRLEDVLTRLPTDEWASVTRAYRVLAEDRGRSWDDGRQGANPKQRHELQLEHPC